MQSYSPSLRASDRRAPNPIPLIGDRWEAADGAIWRVVWFSPQTERVGVKRENPAGRWDRGLTHYWHWSERPGCDPFAPMRRLDPVEV